MGELCSENVSSEVSLLGQDHQSLRHCIHQTLYISLLGEDVILLSAAEAISRADSKRLSVAVHSQQLGDKSFTDRECKESTLCPPYNGIL